MKRILLAGLFLWSSLASAALPLKTKGQNDSTFSDTLRLEAPNSQITTTGDQKVLVETGNGNLLINPNFEHSTTLTGWTLPNGGSGWYSDETTALREGKKSVDYYHGTSGTGGNIYQQVNPPASMRNQPFEYSFDVQGNTGAATNLKVCVLDGASQTETVCQTVTRDNTYKTYRWILVPPASGVTGIGIVADAANSFKFDKAYVGPARNIGVGVPNNVFSAKLSASGVLTDLNQPSWISGCSGTRPFACTLSGFNVAPNCTVTLSPSSAVAAPEITSISSTSITIDTFITNTGAGSGAPTSIICTRAGSDFIQPAITPNNWNYGPTVYTPTFTGFGTVSPSTNQCTHARQGPFLIISCTFTTGTTTATEARVSLPGSLVSKSTYPTLSVLQGSAFVPTSSASGFLNNGQILIEPSKNYFVFQAPTTTTLSKGSGTQFNSSTLTSFTARIEIEGWTENQNAPQLLGSVTVGNGAAAYRHEFGAVDNGTWGAGCTGTCTLKNNSDGVSAAVRTATGKYRLDFVTPNPTGNWNCSLQSVDAPTIVPCVPDSANAPTSSSFYVSCANGASASDKPFTFTCDAKR